LYPGWLARAPPLPDPVAGAMGFSDDGIECLQELIALHKENPDLLNPSPDQR
jgi:hypothetical protein